jgi:undecaprenyl diphosphate synthase
MSEAPRHLAVIPDGNRRWARERNLAPEAGHRAGIQVVGTIAEAAWQAGVETFTFWWGSPANLLHRAPDEVAVITGCLRDWLAGNGASLLARMGASFEIHGRWQELCPAIGSGVDAALAAAGPGPRPRRLVLLMAYDGREEIRAAAEALGGGGPGSDAFGRATWTGALPRVDLLVRTGGDPHMSGAFMAWSAADAQLAFPKVRWPAFTPELLEGILRGYAQTERRYGR